MRAAATSLLLELSCTRHYVYACGGQLLPAGNDSRAPYTTHNPLPALPVQTRTARHKIAKFLRQHAALAVSKNMSPPASSSSLPQGAGAAAADSDARQVRAERCAEPWQHAFGPNH